MARSYRLPRLLKRAASWCVDIVLAISFLGLILCAAPLHVGKGTLLIAPWSTLAVFIVVCLALRYIFTLDAGLFFAMRKMDGALLRAVSRRRADSLLLCGSILLALAAAEILLRAFADDLPPYLGNYLQSGYSDRRSGIYRYDPEWNMPRMRPHYDRQMAFSGYHWRHHTDQRGYRNPVDRASADVVLIGDSMIYGHGVDEIDTVRHQLENITMQPVANLGQQGAAIDHEYEIFRHDVVPLRPKETLVFFFNNDVTSDLTSRLTPEEMERFLAIPVNDHDTRYFFPREMQEVLYGGYQARDFYVVRMCQFAIKYVLWRWGSDREHVHPASPMRAAPAPVVLPPPLRAGSEPTPATPAAATQPGWQDEPPFKDDPNLVLSMRFHLHALSKMQDYATRNGLAWAHVFIYTAQPNDDVYEGIISAHCKVSGIEYYNLKPAFDAAKAAGLELFLPHDGHFSPAGARVAAAALEERFHLKAE